MTNTPKTKLPITHKSALVILQKERHELGLLLFDLKLLQARLRHSDHQGATTLSHMINEHALARPKANDQVIVNCLVQIAEEEGQAAPPR